jgi:hypothetical protein
MADANALFEWLCPIVQEFQSQRAYGHIVVEFREGQAVLVEKKFAQKLMATWPNSQREQNREHRTRP